MRTRLSEIAKTASSPYPIQNRAKYYTRRCLRLWMVPINSRTRKESIDSPSACSCSKARKRVCLSTSSYTSIRSKENWFLLCPASLVITNLIISRTDSPWIDLFSTSTTMDWTWCWKTLWSITRMRRSWMWLIDR